jgi:hypothetical protein
MPFWVYGRDGATGQPINPFFSEAANEAAARAEAEARGIIVESLKLHGVATAILSRESIPSPNTSTGEASSPPATTGAEIDALFSDPALGGMLVGSDKRTEDGPAPAPSQAVTAAPMPTTPTSSLPFRVRPDAIQPVPSPLGVAASNPPTELGPGEDLSLDGPQAFEMGASEGRLVKRAVKSITRALSRRRPRWLWVVAQGGLIALLTCCVFGVYLSMQLPRLERAAAEKEARDRAKADNAKYGDGGRSRLGCALR